MLHIFSMTNSRWGSQHSQWLGSNWLSFKLTICNMCNIEVKRQAATVKCFWAKTITQALKHHDLPKHILFQELNNRKAANAKESTSSLCRHRQPSSDYFPKRLVSKRTRHTIVMPRGIGTCESGITRLIVLLLGHWLDTLVVSRYQLHFLLPGKDESGVMYCSSSYKSKPK